MSRTRLVVFAALVAVAAAGAWLGWRWWQAAQLAPVVRALVPPVPELSAWPPAYAARVREATAAARRLEQPREALGELACLYQANGYYHEAELAERGLQVLEPDSARWAYYLADVCQNLGDADGTRFFLEKALRLAPYYSPIQLRLANLLFKQGDLDGAFTHYEWRLAGVPADPYARLGLARVALERHDRAGAIRYLEAMARDTPEFPTSHNLLAEIYAQMGDAARAQEQRRLTSSSGEFREPEDPWLRQLYAWTFDPNRLQAPGTAALQTQALEVALPFYEAMVRRAPRDGLAYDALGNVELQLDQTAAARATVEAGLAAAPRAFVLYGTLARVLRRQGRPASEVTAVLQRGLAAARAAGDTVAAAALQSQLEAAPAP